MVNAIEAVGASSADASGMPSRGSPSGATGGAKVQPRAPTVSLPSGASDDVGLVFEVNGKTQDLVIKVVDRESKRIIREIPSAEAQRLRSTMQAILGVMVDRRG